MASLMKRGGIWTARVYVDGRERWKSLGTSDRLQAEKRAKDLEASFKGTRWLRQQLDVLLERAERDLLADEVPLVCESLGKAIDRLLLRVPEDQREHLGKRLSRQLASQQQTKIAITEAWQRWLASSNRSTESKDRTIAGYRGIWSRFEAWAKRRGLEWMHEVDEGTALAYADDLWKDRVSPRTFTAHTRFIRSAWSTLRVPAGLGPLNPWASVRPKVKTAESGRRALTPDEIRRVVQSAEGSFRLLLLAGAMTGARLGDITTMRWSDLDLAAAEWSFTPMKTSRTAKRLVLPILEPLLAALRAERQRNTGEFVFPVELALWTRGDLTHRLKDHFEGCAIETNEGILEGQQRKRARILVGFHSLRHAAATLAAKSGVNLAIVQKALGHSTAGMTAGYTHSDAESARQVLAPLAAILGTQATGDGKPATPSLSQEQKTTS